jgi:excinuclease ABC subunit B
MTIPQIGAMYSGDRSRKEALVEYGFRLPSAFDNRPLRFNEFEDRINQAVYVSATPALYERRNSANMVEQIIRPTGLIDPEISVRPVSNQVDDLISEAREVIAKNQRILVTTLTKKMAEELSDYLDETGFKVKYLHSDVETMERMEIIRDLRKGVFDILVGINLLREGLDLPEVALVAILDADKEGFLRSETALIQTIGRAARNVDGRVIMYADKITESMKKAINETERRRILQIEYNRQNGITPASIVKGIRSMIEVVTAEEEAMEYDSGSKKGKSLDRWQDKVKSLAKTGKTKSKKDIDKLLQKLNTEMKNAARELDFERAAAIRDRIKELNGGKNDK